MKLPIIAGAVLAAAVCVSAVLAGVGLSKSDPAPDPVEATREQTGGTLPAADNSGADDALPADAVSGDQTAPDDADGGSEGNEANNENKEDVGVPGDGATEVNNGAPDIGENGENGEGESGAPGEGGEGAVSVPDEGGDTVPAGTDAPDAPETDQPETSGDNPPPPPETTTGDGGQITEEPPVHNDPVPVESGSSDDESEPAHTLPDADDYAGTLAEYFAEIALNELGTAEKKYNNVKYNTWYYGYEVVGKTSNAYAWCAVFVSWCANEAGISTKYIPKTSGVSSMKNFFTSNGLYTKGSTGIKVGDIVFFGSKQSSPSHVGIVVAVENGTIVTIEGNYSDKVSECTYALGSKTILGYATPACF